RPGRLPAVAAPPPRMEPAAVAAGQPGYCEELAAARAGTALPQYRSPRRSRTGPNEPLQPEADGIWPGGRNWVRTSYPSLVRRNSPVAGRRLESQLTGTTV